MFSVLNNKTFLALYLAQIVALLGTGLLTIALGLMAFELAGENAGLVLGIALTIKMIAYVGFSPLANALFGTINRKTVMITTDIVRAAIALCLPFVDAIWQIYVLIFLLQTASATFTPVFQAVIADILPSKQDYTNALSLSRLAYDLENIASPIVAGLLLGLVQFHWLFAGTTTGFALSAILISLCIIPFTAPGKERPFLARLTRGGRIYFNTPRLRGLLCLNFCAASIGAMVIVNSVVIVQAVYGRSSQDLAIAIGAFGVGSIIAALLLPPLLERIADRLVMLTAGACSTVVLFMLYMIVSNSGWPNWPVFLLFWGFAGLGYSAILTPSGRLLRRSAQTEDRPAVFTAQFALSHACWLITYPTAGILGSYAGMDITFLALGLMAFAGLVGAKYFWPLGSGQIVEHSHADLPADHPHLIEQPARGKNHRHSHSIIIDDEHRVWPTQG